MTAEDRDPGINGMVRYHNVAGNQEGHFRMDKKTEQISPQIWGVEQDSRASG